MSNESEKASDLNPGSLVTIAFLKARLDSGDDHLDLFMPIMLDAIGGMTAIHFGLSDIQNAISLAHGVLIPQQALSMLLKRAEKKQLIRHEAGRYDRGPRFPTNPGVDGQKAFIRNAQDRLATALSDYATSRGVVIQLSAAAELILRFLQKTHLPVLRQDTESLLTDARSVGFQELLVAEFIYSVANSNPDLRETLRAMAEGMVLYYAIFRPAFHETTGRSLRGLKVFFDSRLVIQALGWEGAAAEALMRDTLTLLQGEGVSCLVFDATVDELHRILRRIRSAWATASGREQLRPTDMTRFLHLSQASVADLVEMDSILESKMRSIGLVMRPTPPRIPRYTLDEAKLADRLASSETHDTSEPRVVHDVNCIAGILTIRHGENSAHLENCTAIFATENIKVIRNGSEWYVEETNDDVGLSPVGHIRGVATTAWLKKPELCRDIALEDLLVLCSSALRPRQETWTRFYSYLDKQREHDNLSSDEIASLLSSTIVDRLLKEAETSSNDGVDSATLSEIVAQVKEAHGADLRSQLEAERTASSAALLRASETERLAQEKIMVRNAKLRNQNAKVARIVSDSVFGAIAIALFLGSVVIFITQPFPRNLNLAASLATIGVAIAQVLFLIKDVWGVRQRAENWLFDRFAAWTAIEE
ncbi:MAG: hypothetical protein KGN02_01300 [bacterium]|nr:hypothetical protein [bacterium]